MSKMSFLRPEIEKRRLIELVRSNPILWDCRLPHYKRSDKKKALKWNELGRIFGVSGERLQRTFTSLREIFRREFNNEKLLGNNFSSKWEYYDTMAFLKGVIRERKSRDRLKSFPNQDNVGVIHDTDVNACIIDEYQYFAPNDPNNPNNVNTVILQQRHTQSSTSILQNQLENTGTIPTVATTIMPTLKHNKSQRQQLNNSINDNKQQPNEGHHHLSSILQINSEKPTAIPTVASSLPLSIITTTTIPNLIQSQQQQNQHETDLNHIALVTHTALNNDNSNKNDSCYIIGNVSDVSAQQSLANNINNHNQSSNETQTLLQQGYNAAPSSLAASRTSSPDRMTNNLPIDKNALRSSSSSPSVYIKSEMDSNDEDSIDDNGRLTEPSMTEESNFNINSTYDKRSNNYAMYHSRNTSNLQSPKQNQPQVDYKQIKINKYNNMKSLGPCISNNFVTDMHIDLDMEDVDADGDADLGDMNQRERCSINSNLVVDPMMNQAPTAREVLFARFADFLAARLNTLSEQVAHDLMNNVLMLIAEQ